ncbi:MAG: response regulator transcription factor [Enterobacteriaceae bacterium]
MKPGVLIIDDDPDICEILQAAFNEHCFTVYICHQGREALALLKQHTDIDLVLLDLMLPDIHGLALLQQIRDTRPTLPVMMLTGLNAESDIVVGLEMGADDYIAKPFLPRVVVARVKAVLRRSRVGSLHRDQGLQPIANTGNTPKNNIRGWQFAGWQLDLERSALWDARQQQINLTHGEFRLLLAMVQNAQKVLTREQLLELTHSDTLDIFDRTIDVLIMRLRRKIEPNPTQPELIRTIRGLGYVFAADVSRSVCAS